MTVDVKTEIDIDRPVADVAAYTANPDNAPEWYANIVSVEWTSDPPLAVRSTVAFVARFLGRRLAYTYDVVELVPGERLVMRTAEGPFPMETTYTWAPTSSGGTHMTLRNRGAARRVPASPAAVHGHRDATRQPQGPGQAQGDPRVGLITADAPRHGWRDDGDDDQRFLFRRTPVRTRPRRRGYSVPAEEGNQLGHGVRLSGDTHRVFEAARADLGGGEHRLSELERSSHPV